MSDTHQWDIEIEAPYVDAIGSLGPNSVYYTGPFLGGAVELVCNLELQNIGTETGSIYAYLYEYPGTPEENILIPGYRTVAPGESVMQEVHVNIPTDLLPGEFWPVGVKCWGEGETEPVWGGLGTTRWTLGRMELPTWAIPAVALGGLLGISYLALKK